MHVTCTFTDSLTPPDNDDFADAEAITGVSGDRSGNTSQATAQSGEPAHGPTAAAHSVWYSWTAPSAGTVTFDTCGSGYDTMLAAYTGSAVTALSQLASNDDSCGLQSQISFAAQSGVTYAVAVDGWSGRSGSYSLSWSHVAGAAAPESAPAESSAAK